MCVHVSTCVLLVCLVVLIRFMQEGSLDSFVHGLYSHKLMVGAFCIVALGVHILLVYVQRCADLFGVHKEGCKLNGNMNSKVLLPNQVDKLAGLKEYKGTVPDPGTSRPSPSEGSKKNLSLPHPASGRLLAISIWMACNCSPLLSVPIIT